MFLESTYVDDIKISFKLTLQIMADYNQIEELAPNMLSDVVNLTTINLTMNQLEKFPLSTLKLSKGRNI